MPSNDFLREYEIRFLPTAEAYAPKGPRTLPYKPAVGTRLEDLGGWGPPLGTAFVVSDVVGRVVWVDLRDREL